MTTSFTATLHGDFGAAWVAHPFGTLFYAIFTVSAALALWGWIGRTRIDSNTKGFNRAALAFTAVFVVFGVARFSTVEYGSDIYKAVGFGRTFTQGQSP